MFTIWFHWGKPLLELHIPEKLWGRGYEEVKVPSGNRAGSWNSPLLLFHASQMAELALASPIAPAITFITALLNPKVIQPKSQIVAKPALSRLRRDREVMA